MIIFFSFLFAIYAFHSNAQLNVNAGADQYINHGEPAYLNPTISGGSGYYTFYWSSTPPDMTLEYDQLTQTVYPNTTTTYTIEVFDDSLFTNATDMLVVTVAGGASFGVTIESSTSAICQGNGVALWTNIVGGSGIYDYIWSAVPADSATQGATDYLYTFPTVTTTYSVSVTDVQTSQTVSSSIVITVNPPIDVDFTIQPAGLLTYQFTSVVNNLSPGDTISMRDWDFGDYTMEYDLPVVFHTYASPGTYEVMHFVHTTNGCNGSKIRTLIAQSGPVFPVSLGPDKTVCGQTTVTLNPTIMGGMPPYTFHWSSDPWDPTLVDTVASQVLMPMTTTTYYLQVTDNAPITGVGYDTLVVTVNEIPWTTVWFNPTDSIGLTYLFETNTYYGQQPITYSWNFGDGNTGTGPNPIHTYPGSGDYTLTLQVTEANGCQFFDTLVVNVRQQGFCTANFTHSIPDTINNPHRVQFNNLSTGNISDYYWDFGDGNFSSLASPTHTYQYAGFYWVTLSVYDTVTFCWNWIGHEIQVGNIYDSCWANFTHTALSGLDVQFTDASVHANQYYWYFGDGYSSYDKNPIHTFPYSGQFMVELSTQDSLTGCWSYKSKMVNVGSTFCYVNYTYVVNPITNKVNFTADCDQSVTQFLWNFGDNTTSTLRNPEKTYAQPGMYYVTLSGTDSSGQCVNSYSMYIQVGQVTCNASFTAVIVPNTLTVNFTNNTQASTVQLFWDFGDGSFSYNRNPSHTYAYPGFYYVNLSIYDSISGCWDWFGKDITVGSAVNDCVADFQFFVLMANNKVFFTDKSLGTNLTNYWWSFGDGATDTIKSPVHQYTTAGYYDVCLTVSDANGNCSNTTCKYILVGNAPSSCLANFTFTADTINKRVTFRDASSTTPSMAFWDFGDGQWSDASNPTHQYTNSGIYTVYYYIFTSTGCFSDAVKLINLTGNTGIVGGFVFTIDSTNTKANSYPVSYKGATFGDPARMNWEFGDGNTASNVRNVRHEYQNTGTYTVKFTVSDPNTNQSHTSTRLVNVTGLKKYERPLGSINFYPNPMKQTAEIFFTLLQPSEVEIWITDISGKTLESIQKGKHYAGINHITWNNTKIKPGLYFLHVRSQSQQLVTKIIIAE